MGNPRSFTTNHNAINRALEAFVRARAGRSQSKRREAVERAKSMPNRLSPSSRASIMQGEGR